MSDLVLSANGEVEMALREIRAIRSPSYARQATAAVQRYAAWATDRSDEALTIRLESYGRHLAEQGLKPQSVRQAIAPLKLVVRQLAKASGDIGLYRDVQAAISLVELPKVQRGGKLPFWLSTAQATALLRAASGRDRLILLLMLACGLRRAEVAGLQPSDFSQQDGHTVLTVRNKGRTRSLPVLPIVVRALEANGWTVGISPRSVFDVVRRHGKRIGLPELRPHDLRRTFARAFHESGGGLHDLAAVLGHASVETTRRYIGIGFDLDAMVRPLPYLKGLG